MIQSPLELMPDAVNLPLRETNTARCPDCRRPVVLSGNMAFCRNRACGVNGHTWQGRAYEADYGDELLWEDEA